MMLQKGSCSLIFHFSVSRREKGI